MAGFLRVVSLDDVREKLKRIWVPSQKISEVKLGSAFGRVAASDVVSRIDLPPFDKAAFDGYAVVASDTFGANEEHGRRLRLCGEVRPGWMPKIMVRKGFCARISTGAPMPARANAVVMCEHVTEDGETILVKRPVAPGENVTKRGSDVRRGGVVVKRGTLLTPIHIGAMAAAGVESVAVFKKPRVALFSTGDELVPPGRKPIPGKIYDSNGPALVAGVIACGGDPIYLGICPDDRRRITSFVVRGLRLSDIVVISGGTSAGGMDLVPEAIRGVRGSRIIFHGLAQKPGKPALVAIARGKPIFGLPGYPVSSVMVFENLVADQIRRLSGFPNPPRHVVHAILGSKVISVAGRKELVPVMISKEGKRLVAHPVLKDSGAIVSLSSSHGYIEVPAKREIVEKGEVVEVIKFTGAGAC